jgi:hypothetical protein
MIDPVSAFAMATTAYNAVKKGIEMGQELEGMAGQLGQWFTACADVRQAEEEAKNPPLFKKLLSKGSVEAEALENTIRRKKIQEQEKELWQMIIYTYGMETYEEMIQERRRIAAERTRIAHLQAEKRKAAALNTLYVGLIAGLCYLGYQMALFVISVWPKGSA